MFSNGQQRCSARIELSFRSLRTADPDAFMASDEEDVSADQPSSLPSLDVETVGARCLETG